MDEPLPHIRFVTPMLRAVGVGTFRDVLELDLESMQYRKGVGKQKLATVRRLRDEARARAEGLVPRSSPEADAALAQPIPSLPYVTPLLRSEGVRTYRDALGLNIAEIGRKPGVGAKKRRALREVHREALARARGGFAVSRTEAASPYDDWEPLRALGRLSGRARKSLSHAGLQTIGALRRWHATTDRDEIHGYGEVTQRELEVALRRLDREGHEVLVFGGSEPGDLESLGAQYFTRLDPDTCALFQRKFVERATLTQVGREVGLTRERVRQIVAREIELDRPAWGACARRLVRPAATALASRGGVATTGCVLAASGSPPRWALEIGAKLAGLDLGLDLVPGISTTHDRQTLKRLRTGVRTDLWQQSNTRFPRSLVHESLASVGLRCPDEELPRLADAWLGVVVCGTHAFFVSGRVVAAVLDVLRTSTEPLSLDALVRGVRQQRPGLDVAGENILDALQYIPTAVRVGDGRYVYGHDA